MFRNHRSIRPITFSHLMFRNHCSIQPTPPDISLASLSLLPHTSWQVHKTFSSDHLPITISITSDMKPQLSENETFNNFKKANWSQFNKDTEEQFKTLPPPMNILKAEKTFRKIISKAAKQTYLQEGLRTLSPRSRQQQLI